MWSLRVADIVQQARRCNECVCTDVCTSILLLQQIQQSKGNTDQTTPVDGAACFMHDLAKCCIPERFHAPAISAVEVAAAASWVPIAPVGRHWRYQLAAVLHLLEAQPA